MLFLLCNQAVHIVRCNGVLTRLHIENQVLTPRGRLQKLPQKRLVVHPASGTKLYGFHEDIRPYPRAGRYTSRQMSTIPLEVPEEVLRRLGARSIAPLGGRLNLHWHIEVQNTPLVLRRWAQSASDVAYEVHLLERIAALGWPVAPVLEEPFALAGYLWSLSSFLPGDPPNRTSGEQRAQGRLLAELHTDLATLTDIGQRGMWRRGEAILADPKVEPLLCAKEPEHPEGIRILLWHLERARARVTGLALQDRPDQLIHGDFAPWNLRFQNGKLSGILDFELAHRDHCLGDFALAWRGKYDGVIHGYHEVSPLEPEEWALLTPLWWAFLIENAYQLLREGTWDDGWILSKLLQRSPLMGPDAAPFSAL